MAAEVIDGKQLAKQVQSELASEIEQWCAQGNRAPHLAVVLVGDDPASRVYVASKSKKAKAIGMSVSDVPLAAETSDQELQKTLRDLGENPEVDGILLQLPLPAGLDEFAALLCIPPEKDVDGLHPFSQGLLVRGAKSYVPCTPQGCMRLIEQACEQLARSKDLSGLHAVVLGRSILVGKPMASLLLEANCTVSICHSRTKDLVHTCSEADILVAAVGRPSLVTENHIKSGAIVIDVGINRSASGSLVGDVDFNAAAKKAAAITPVPGGVGPMTIAMLLSNTVLAAKRGPFSQSGGR